MAQNKMQFTLPEDYVSFGSRIGVRNCIMEALKDDSRNIIGIYGMGGVGKTTLVKEIADELKADKLFDEVAMVGVSNDADVAKIQDQLAEKIGLKFEEKTDHQRAKHLYTRLMNSDGRILVILDDLSKELEFNIIGIPVNGECKGIKIMLTSRLEGVCTNMGAKSFEIKVLSETESWHHFKNDAEISDVANDVINIAKEVAKECGGLPLVIVVVGMALKNKREHVWTDDLQQLKEASVAGVQGTYDLVSGKTEHLSLNVSALTSFINEFNRKWFSNLTTLSLTECDIKYLVDTNGFLTSGDGGNGVFVNLEYLFIEDANNLEELCNGNLPSGSFAKLREVHVQNAPVLRQLWGAIQRPSLGDLRILDIEDCNSLTSVFLQSSVDCLCELQEIRIKNCQGIETVVLNDEENEKVLEFPNLKILELEILNAFKSFGPESNHNVLSGKVMLPELEILIIYGLQDIKYIIDDQMPSGSLSKLRTIEVSYCNGLVHIAASETIKILQTLETLKILGCTSLQVVFDFTDLTFERVDVESLLCQLQSLSLSYVRNLTDICRRLPERFIFKKLKSISLERCDKLRYLFSPVLVKVFTSLEHLQLKYCRQMEAIIGMERRVISETEFEEEISTIEFPKLESLSCSSLLNIRMLCSQKVDLVLSSLTKMEIYSCERMNKFCAGRLIVPSFHNVMGQTHAVSLKYGNKTIVGNEFNSWLQECQSERRCLRCLRCSFYRDPYIIDDSYCVHFNE